LLKRKRLLVLTLANPEIAKRGMLVPGAQSDAAARQSGDSIVVTEDLFAVNANGDNGAFERRFECDPSSRGDLARSILDQLKVIAMPGEANDLSRRIARNLVADEAISADSPNAAATTWTRPPTWTPNIDVTPALLPCTRLRVTM